VPVIPEKARARFVLQGSDLEPTDLIAADDRDRRTYWTQVAVLARNAKYRELRKGLDVNGQPLIPRQRVRRDRARGPVLIPHRNDSRFITQLRWKATSDGAVLWWRFPWGRIVAYHANRRGPRRLPVRDVVGLTTESVNRVREEAFKFWAAFREKGRPAQEVQGLAFPDGTGRRQTAILGPGRMPSPRRRDSIFTPPPFPRLAPVRVTVPLPTRSMPPWELQRLASELMDAAYRGATTEAGIDAWIAQVRQTQSLAAVRDVLRRLGVVEAVPDWTTALDLLRRQAMSRLAGRFPNVWSRTPPPGPLGGPVGVRPRGPRPRPIRAAVAVGAGTVGLAGLLWWAFGREAAGADRAAQNR
jgi:hypothetical protein